MNTYHKFPDNIYDSIMENDETWMIHCSGGALIIYDVQLLDY